MDDYFFEWVEEYSGITGFFIQKILLSIFLIISLLVFKRFLHRIIPIKGVKQEYKWRKGIDFFINIFIIINLSFLWISEFKSITTFLGLLTAGLAIALKEPVVNFFGWFYILFRKPLEVGNRIQIGAFSGDVVDISMFEFSMMEIGNWVDADQSTGRVVHVPNGKVFNEPILNFNKAMNNIWNELVVVLTFDSNWELCKKIMIDIANEKLIDFKSQKPLQHGEKDVFVRYKKLTPIVYTTVAEYGVHLTLRYLVKPKERRNSEHFFWETLLIQFRKHNDIKFNIPLRRYIQFENQNPTT